MEGDMCPETLAFTAFGQADLGHARRTKRLVQLGAAVMSTPDQPLPNQCKNAADRKAAYRLLSNDEVDPHAIQLPYRKATLAECAAYPVVLSVQDTTEIDLTTRKAMKGRGKLGRGSTEGLLQHSAIAVVPADDDQPIDAPATPIGILHQQWDQRGEPPKGETTRELQQRRTNADVWQETTEAIAELGSAQTRLIHVGDRHSDIFRFMQCCLDVDHGYIARARYDRDVLDDQGQVIDKLWPMLELQQASKPRKVTVHQQRTPKGEVRCAAREAKLVVRYARVTIPTPANDIRTQDASPIECYAVLVREMDPPEGAEPLEWVLFTSEPVTCEAQAWQIVRYYRHRWVIEEWHRVLKEGCALEEGQFDDAMDIQRLAAIKAVAAMHLLQLRDLAERVGDNPQALQKVMPWEWIVAVAMLAKVAASDLTPAQFQLTVAKRGGYLNRKHDRRPGWKVLWRGWNEIQLLVEGMQMSEKSCGYT